MSPVTKASTELRALSNTACIVGVDESDEIGTLPNKSQLTLHLEAISNAVKDAGLEIKDVDGIFTAGQHPPSLLGEALGITPRIVDGTSVGGCSFIMMAGHAVAALHHHLCSRASSRRRSASAAPRPTSAC
jgi:3-oxoacyl-[acyl-carrier-protein] synthase III